MLYFMFTFVHELSPNSLGWNHLCQTYRLSGFSVEQNDLVVMFWMLFEASDLQNERNNLVEAKNHTVKN